MLRLLVKLIEDRALVLLRLRLLVRFQVIHTARCQISQRNPLLPRK
jgi:hypothetical protein